MPRHFQGSLEVLSDATGADAGLECSKHVEHLTDSIAAREALGALLCRIKFASSVTGLCPVFICTFLAAFTSWSRSFPMSFLN